MKRSGVLKRSRYDRRGAESLSSSSPFDIAESAQTGDDQSAATMSPCAGTHHAWHIHTTHGTYTPHTAHTHHTRHIHTIHGTYPPHTAHTHRAA
jgi:hypothetical protein